MKKSQPAGRQGFTLLEILVSVGILAMVTILLAQVLFTTTHVNKKTELVINFKQNGTFVLDVIGRLVRASIAIETSCNSGQTSTPSARIRNADYNVTVLTCFSDGNVARIASVSGTGKVVYLSGGNVTLSASGGVNCSDSSLAFSCPPASGGMQSELIVSFTLGQPGVTGSAFESGKSSFQSTIGVRN
ncbi:MAG: prepilin-type N-terminal cleavage/methylation domain-containing protein [Candidatus Gottesmanbacteria bacterium]|nr:prepilin-type N-terminal cleavage/methylation domain-containing protein [Candidatus Gottesmanbacteria bacterium]